MALEGTLRDFSFADILQLISLQRKTGVLTLKNEDDVVTISFLEGKIVATSSLNQRAEDRLGLILLKQGAVTEAQLDAALRKQEETLQRVGRILIDEGIAPPEVVRRALEQQILQVVYRVFRWSDGEYHFSQETDIDFDRELMVPMAVDSIIMEGARMTDEWPFIDQRIPDRQTIFRKVDPTRELEVVEEPEEIDLLGFSFMEAVAGKNEKAVTGNQLTPNQAKVYELVNGRDSVDDIILKSELIDFETCKALAELLDHGLIREATPEEVVEELSRETEPVRGTRPGLGAVPWLALPFLVLLGFSISVMPQNPVNPSFSFAEGVWSRFITQTVSWSRLDRLLRSAETAYLLTGTYPETPDALVKAGVAQRRDVIDPWGRTYRMVLRGHKLLAAGTDARGEPVPKLLLSRGLVWEGAPPGGYTGPGVVLIE
jgi:hypothetical protein